MTPETQEGALVGALLGGYQLLALLGAGGMAEVYRARDPRTGREVAIKILPEALAQDLSYVYRFREEAQRISALDHPNVVKVYYFGQDAGRYYLLMPVVPESLRDRMDRFGMLRPLDAARIAIQVAGGLDAAHTHGLVHRDVKPENILLNEQGIAMLTDFGIAREIDVLRDATTARTPAITGLPVGTPEYMAPEQLRGGVADQRMDVYGLGAVLYEMLTGRVPHQAETPFEVAVKALTEPTLPPSIFNNAITPELERVVLNALASEQRDRYPNMRSFAAALRRAMLERAVGSGAMAEAVAALGPLPAGPSAPTRYLEKPERQSPHFAAPLPSAAANSGGLVRKHPLRGPVGVASGAGSTVSSPAARTLGEALRDGPDRGRMAPVRAGKEASSHSQVESARTARPHQGGRGHSPHEQPARIKMKRRRISPQVALASAVLMFALVAFGGLAVTGNLRWAFGGQDAAFGLFSHFPGATTAPTATVAPTLTFAPTTVNACHNGSFTILYRGATPTVEWSASAPPGVTLTPSSGTLTSGVSSAPIAVSAAQPGSGTITITAVNASLTASVAYTC